MGRIPQESIDEVLARTDILSVVSQYVSLKRAGVNHKGLCPFHDENTPSFNVHPGKGIYKCFGCGAGGNVFNFLMDLEGWNFPEVVRHLAGRCGVELPEESDEDAEARRQRQRARDLYHDLMVRARAFYERNLWDEQVGARAREYLSSRGIDEATAREFGLGYAPEGWQNLLDYLGENGMNGALVERAGLAIARKSGKGHYDRFRDRVLFPVIDIWGNTLAFGGRVLPGDDGPKYINSSETRFYTKGRNLFGLHAAKKGIQEAEWALLVEGNFDVIALHAVGLKMAVSPMGTAFTERQARLLKRYAGRAVIGFDGDKAGEEATARALESIEEAGLEGLVIRFARSDDPDTFVRREGVEALEAKVEEATPLIQWALDRVVPSGSERLPIEERVRLLEQASQIMEHVREPIAWKHYAEELSRRLDIEARLFKRYLKRPERAARQLLGERGEREERAQAARRRKDRLELDRNEFTLLVLLLEHPDWLEGFLDEQLENLLRSAELAELLHQTRRLRAERGEGFSPALLIEHVAPHIRPVVTDALANTRQGMIVEDLAGAEVLAKVKNNAVKVYEDTVRSLKIEWAKRSQEDLSIQLESLKDQGVPFTNEEYRGTVRGLEQLGKFIEQIKEERKDSANTF